MNILTYVHIHRLPNPSGVGRVIDRLLTHHAALFPASRHRMLVDGKLYDATYLRLSDPWKTASFIPYRNATRLQQARWVLQRRPVAEDYWKDVDLVYCPAESFVPVREAKLVCTIHDLAGFERSLYPWSFDNQFHRLKWARLIGSMVEDAHAVVTVSEFSASRVSHFFPGLAGRLHVICNAPHEVFGSSCADWDQSVEALSGGCPFVLVPGGLSLRKNADLILDTLPLLADRMPDVKVVVAGKNEANYVKRLQRRGNRNHVLAGYVPDAMLNALYQRAAAVWFPSRYEGFGMPVIEAMAAGAPVIASRAASIPEVAGDAAMLCGMDDPAEHVEAIHAVLSSSRIRNEMCSRGKTQAGRFTWESSARQLEALFQSL